MDITRKEFNVGMSAHPSTVKEMVKGILHVIFFHRSFQAIRPVSRDILGVTLPTIDDPGLEALFDQRATALIRQTDMSSLPSSYTSTPIVGGIGRGLLCVQFFEKRRRKSYFAFGKADEEVCWEQWNIYVTLAKPKKETDAENAREAMRSSLHKAAMKIVSIASQEKDHIPPITTSETNPFPYQITVNLKDQGWGK